MSSVIFESAQRIIVQVLNWFQTSNLETVSNLITDTAQTGVMKNLLGEFPIVAGSNNTALAPSITVGTGIAYDVNTARIAVLDTLTTYNSTNPSITTNDGLGNLIPTPQSTGNVNIPLTANSFNYVWVEYLATIDVTAFTLNKITNAKQFYKQTDGYQIIITTTFVPPSASAVFLGSVNLTGSGTVSPTTISQSGRTYYQIYQYRAQVQTPKVDKSDITTSYALGNAPIFIDDHVKAIGTGAVSAINPHGISPADIGISSSATVQNHQEFFHTSGITGSPSSISSSLHGAVTTVNPGFDFITIQPLITSEEAMVNGLTITSVNIPSATILNFSSLDPTGNWYIYVNNSNFQVQRTQTNLISTPNPNYLLLYSIVYTITGSGPTTHGALSSLTDYRAFGTIGPNDIQTSAVGSGLTGGADSPISAVTDGSTLDINGSNQIEVKANGITPTQLNTSVTGTALTGGGGSPLSVVYDNSTIVVSSNQLEVGTITGSNIANNSIPASKLEIDNSTIVNSGGTLEVGAITDSNIGDNSISGRKIIIDNSTLVTSVNTLEVGTITGSNIASNTVSASNLNTSTGSISMSLNNTLTNFTINDYSFYPTIATTNSTGVTLGPYQDVGGDPGYLGGAFSLHFIGGGTQDVFVHWRYFN